LADSNEAAPRVRVAVQVRTTPLPRAGAANAPLLEGEADLAVARSTLIGEHLAAYAGT